MATPAVSNNNPGNLKSPEGGFLKFNSPQEGFAALLNDLKAKQTGTTTTGLGPDSSIVDFASVYAPSSDNNNVGQYAANLANQLKVPPNAKLKDLPLGPWAMAVAKNEDNSSLFGAAKAGYVTQGSLPPKTTPEQPIEEDAEENSLGNMLKARLGDASDAASLAAKGGVGNIASGALQFGGALAGGLLDVSQKALESIPVVGYGVKKAEQAIGGVIGAAADTKLGRDVVTGLQEFAQTHPEAAKNIEASLNLLSVIPVFRGLSFAGTAAKTAVSKTLEGSLKKAAISELEGVVGRRITGLNWLDQVAKRKLNPAQYLVENKILPEVGVANDGIPRYNSLKAYQEIGQSLGKDEALLQSKIDAVSPDRIPTSSGLLQQGIRSTTGKVSLEDLRKEALQVAKSEFSDSGQVGKATSEINRVFDDYINSKGPYVDLKQLNAMKRGIREAVNFKSEKLESDVSYQLGQLFMKKIESVASARGETEIRDLNRIMAEKLEAQNLLKQMHNRSVTPSPGLLKAMRGYLSNAAVVGGEAVGQSFGAPVVGGTLGKFIASHSLKGGGSNFPSLLKLRPGALKSSTLQKVGPLVPVLRGGNQQSQQ